MKLPPFDYYAPESLDGLLSLLQEHAGDAKILAGGQSLVPLLALRLAHPAVLIDMNRVPGLSEISRSNGSVAIGAMTREHAAEDSAIVQTHVPLLAAAIPYIGHRAIRTRGTIGGTVAHADPSAETPTVALALDADIVARSEARGERVIPAAEFFQGFLTTGLDEDEVVTEVRFPVAPPQSGASFKEVARRHGDFAIVGVAAQVQLDVERRVQDARIALMGVSDTPVRRPEAEDVIKGSRAAADVLEAAGKAAVVGLSPPTDLHGTSAYRLHLVQVLVRQALLEAAQRAEAAE